MTRRITDPKALELFSLFKSEELPETSIQLALLELDAVALFDLVRFRSLTKPAPNTEAVKAMQNSFPVASDIPVYTASLEPIARIPEVLDSPPIFPNAENPDVSFASNGDGSAGRNFLQHSTAYYVLSDRTCIHADAAALSMRYVFELVQGIRERFGFNRERKAIKENLKRTKFIVGIPPAQQGYSSRELQELLAAFIAWFRAKLAAVTAFADGLLEHADASEKAVLEAMFEEQATLGVNNRLEAEFDEWAAANNVSVKFTELDIGLVTVSGLFDMKTGTDVSVSGQKYSKTYYQGVGAAGSVAVYTGSTSPWLNIKPLHPDDVQTGEAISFNQENNKVLAFYHPKAAQFIVGGHHVAMRLKPGLAHSTKYLALSLQCAFNNTEFAHSASASGLGAGTGRVGKLRIAVPLCADAEGAETVIADFLNYRIAHYAALKEQAAALKEQAAAMDAAFISAVAGSDK